MKKTAPHTSSAARRKAKNSAYDDMKKHLFPVDAATCFECDTPLTSANRKRIATFHRIGGGLIASGHQLCGPCAAKAQKGLHLCPKMNSDLMAARFGFMGRHAPCAGGMQ